MARCLNLTKTGEYAVAALARLALAGEGRGSVTARSLAHGQGIPESFLAKILSQCARAGIVSARRGPEGGVSLSRPAEEITLLSILESCEGSYRRSDCVFYRRRKCEGPSCDVYCPLRREEEGVRDRLAGVSLADMASSLRDHPEEGGKRCP